MIETWEHLQARLFHLGWLGEELAEFTTTPAGTWLYRQIAHEAAAITEIATAYLTESARAGFTTPPTTTPGITAPATDATPAAATTSPNSRTDQADTGTQPERGGAA